MKIVLRSSAISLLLLGACTNESTPIVPTSPPEPTDRFGSFDEAVVVANDPPPPISGGTLLVFDKGRQAAVADPNRDHVVIVNLQTLAVGTPIALKAKDEPGRLVADAAGRLHVALRGGGAIVTIDPVAGAVTDRTAACPYPRGLAYDATGDVIHLACSGGELLTFPAAGGAPTRSLKLDSDLRDVVIDGSRLLVSRFRAAELLVVEADGTVSERLQPRASGRPDASNGSTRMRTPAVAWRTIAAPGGGALMVHQQDLTTEVKLEAGGYGSQGCGGGIVASAVSLFRPGVGVSTTPDIAAALPVDVASGNGRTVLVASAGSVPASSSPKNGPSLMMPFQQAVFQPVVIAPQPATPSAGDTGQGESGLDVCGAVGEPVPASNEGAVVAVAIDSSGRAISQTLEPPTLSINGQVVKLPGAPRPDTGQKLFHMATSGGLACASCHPEGHEDGHTWTFAGLGSRRTQAVNGGILGTEPFHWNGDMDTFTKLAHDVFNTRMSGPSLREDHVTALSGWVDKVPAQRLVVGNTAVSRGRELFNNAKVACASCHTGDKLTNNQTADVGTGKFQVPSLVGLSWRAPYMHDGCASTIEDRFRASCGGAKHGDVNSLTANQKADLVAYLESL